MAGDTQPRSRVFWVIYKMADLKLGSRLLHNPVVKHPHPRDHEFCQIFYYSTSHGTGDWVEFPRYARPYSPEAKHWQVHYKSLASELCQSRGTYRYNPVDVTSTFDSVLRYLRFFSQYCRFGYLQIPPCHSRGVKQRFYKKLAVSGRSVLRVPSSQKQIC